MNASPYPRPVLFMVSAPSGAGKTTLCQRLLAEEETLRYSISCTTRPPRDGERDGVDYVFLSREAFDAEVAAGAFLEHADVYGHGYGTRSAFLLRELAAGRSVLMDVDVQGAAQIREAVRGRPLTDPLRVALVDVFISPPSLEELHDRLVSRGQDAPEVIERRMRNARHEMSDARSYAYQIVNDDLEDAWRIFHAIYRAAGHRTLPVSEG